MKKLLSIGASFILVLSVFTTYHAVDASYVQLNVSDTLTVGDYATSIQLTPTIYPKNADQTVTYKAEPEDGATIKDGLVTLTGTADEVKITVLSTTEGVFSEVTIMVDPSVTDLETMSFNQETLMLTIDEQFDIKPLLNLSDVNHQSMIYFESSHPSIVSVDYVDGILRAIHPTTLNPVTIYAYGNVNQLVATIEVSVGAPISTLTTKQDTYYLLASPGITGTFDVSKEVLMTSTIPGIQTSQTIDSYEIIDPINDHLTISQEGILDYTLGEMGDEALVRITAGPLQTDVHFIVQEEYVYIEELSVPKQIILSLEESYDVLSELTYMPTEATLPLQLTYVSETEEILLIEGSVLTGKVVGETILTVKDEQTNIETTMKVTVIDTYPEEITLTNSRDNVIEVGQEITITANIVGGEYVYDEAYFKLVKEESKDMTHSITLEAIHSGEVKVSYEFNQYRYTNNYVIVNKPAPLPITGIVAATSLIGLTLAGIGAIILLSKKKVSHEI